MVLSVSLKTIFGKLASELKPLRRLIGYGERQIFIPSPTGGFVTIQRSFWESPFERINNWLAQIHASISRSALSPNSPLIRIWNMFERLLRTLFLPLELIISSLFMPIMPLLRFGIRIMFTTFMPIAIQVFKFMLEVSNTIENALNALTFLAGIFGFSGKPSDKDEDDKQKSFWEQVWDFFQNLFRIPEAEATSEGIRNTSQQQTSPITEFFNRIYNALTQHPIANQIYELAVTKILLPTAEFINKFNRAFTLHPTALQIYELAVSKMLFPVMEFINKFNRAFTFHPFALQIYELAVSKIIFPVLTFINNFNNAIINHPVSIGINQLIQQNVINPIVELIAKIATKFNEINNSIASKINEVGHAINNLINSIQSRINALASSVSIGGGGGGGRTTSGIKGMTGGFGLGTHTGLGGGRPSGVHPLQHGGLLLEPVFGIGLMTGRRYTFAEKQPELVAPIEKTVGTSGIVINVTINGNIIGINDFENRIKQIVEMELRRVR
jgi:hypothetical protein